MHVTVQKDVANLKQQRLKSKDLILNPTSTIITLFVIGLIFAPIGGVLVWGSGLVRPAILLPASLLTQTRAHV